MTLCLDKNLSRMVGKELSNSKRKLLICKRCLNYFITEEKRVQHSVYCENTNEYHISFSSEKHIFQKFLI